MALRISCVEITTVFGRPVTRSRPADFGMELLFELVGRSKCDLDLFRGAFAQRQAVLLLDEGDDRLVELVSTDANRLAGHDPTERDNRDFGRATTDVDHHVAGRLVDRQARADRCRHRLLDDVGLAGSRCTLAASITARCSTPVMPEGTQITMRGLAKRRWWTRWMK